MDAAGKILFPSFIDVHTHLREPGYEWKETVATGLSSAAHGGFGAILCMANTDPVNDDAAVTEQILESARRSWPNGPRVHPIGAATVCLLYTSLDRKLDVHQADDAQFLGKGHGLAFDFGDGLGGQRIEMCIRDSVRHEPHARVQPDVLAVITCDASAFLPAMLEGVQTEIGHPSRFRMSRNTKNSAHTIPFVTKRAEKAP